MPGASSGRNLTIAAVGLLAVLHAPAQAAKVRSATFDITSVNTNPAGTIKAKVWIAGRQAKSELKHPRLGSLVMLVSGDSFYRLDAKGKKGLKSPLPPAFKKHPDPFTFLFGQFAFEGTAALKQGKKIRSETVGGYACDVLEVSETKGPASQTVTVWKPKVSPPFPVKAVRKLKMTKDGKTQSQTVSIALSNIKLNAPVPDSVFRVPAGYQIKTVTPPAAPSGKK